MTAQPQPVPATVTYRPYEPGDAEALKAIIDESFFIHRYVTAPRLLGSALEVYLRERLVASTHTRVAVLDGQVVGVLMGQIVGQPRRRDVARNRLTTWAHMLRLAVLGLTELASLRQHFAFGRVYRTLRAKAAAPLTDELTLFAVSAAARGHGVGTALYRDFMARLREHGRTDFYLYTDSLCTFEFYERRGMRRAAEQDMTVRLDDEPSRLGVYLYTGSVA